MYPCNIIHIFFAVFAPFTTPLLEMLGVEMIPNDPVAFFRRLMEQLIDERQRRRKVRVSHYTRTIWISDLLQRGHMVYI